MLIGGLEVNGSSLITLSYELCLIMHLTGEPRLKEMWKGGANSAGVLMAM